MNVIEQDKPIGLRGADILFDILKQCMEDAQTSEPGVSITKVEQTTISNEDGGENVITVTLSDGKKSSFTVRNGSAGIKGDPGINGVTPIIEAAAGENINVVGTPSVMASTNGNTTTFIFDKLKGEKGDPGKDGINATTTQIATPTASGLMDAAMVAKLSGIAEGANVVTHVSQLVNDSGYITAASIPGSLPANGGNADTVNGWHAMDIFSHRGLSDASAADPNVGGAWSINLTGVNFTGGWLNVVQFSEGHFVMQFGMNTSSTKLYVRTRYISSGWAGWEDCWRDVTNADTVDGLPSYQLETLDSGGGRHRTSYPMYCQHNLFGDNRFGIAVPGHELRVHYATAADYAASAGSATSATNAGSANSASYAVYATDNPPETPSLKNLAVGTAAANASNCPSGAWYGQYS